MTEVNSSLHNDVPRNLREAEAAGNATAGNGRRPYRLGQRAEEMARTRQRIAEATFELHRDIGPAATTISAIAELAGVQRHTVYRHFPDMASLYAACTAHGMKTTGLPDPDEWRAIADPVERLRLGLSQMYDYYARNERLMTNILRDALADPALTETDAFRDYWGRVNQALAEPWPEGSSGPTVVGLALDFWTWRSLVRGQGKTAEEAVALFVDMARSASPKRAEAASAA